MKVNKIKTYKTQTDFEAAIAQLSALMRQKAEKTTAMQSAIDAIQAAQQPAIEALNAEIAQLEQSLCRYAEKHRAALTNNGKKQSFATAYGVVKWRKLPASVQISGDIETIIAALKKRRLSRFLRVKTELNKQALLAESAQLAAKPIEGLNIITGGETISISTGETHA